mgnify:CR=1 FL=1
MVLNILSANKSLLTKGIKMYHRNYLIKVIKTKNNQENEIL